MKGIFKRTICIVFSLFLFFQSIVLAERIAVLPEINNPGFDFIFDRDQFYVIEGAVVYIYSMRDFKLKKKFGKKGEGPEEFKVRIDDHVYITPWPEYILVESVGKISYFSRDGRFINERRVPSNYSLLQPLSVNKFVGFVNELNKKKRILHQVLGIFDQNLSKVKEICLCDHNLQEKGLTLLRGTFLFRLYKESIFVSLWGGDFILHCYDKNGELKFTIQDKKFRKRKVSKKDVERIHDYFKLYHKEFYAKNKNFIKLKEYWPAIGIFFIDSDIVYVATYVRKLIQQREMWLFYLYDINGKLLKKVYLPLVDRDIWAPYPYNIYNGKLYQLIENEDTEQWELHSFPIE